MKRGWEIKKLGDFYDITSSKRVFQSEWKNEGIPFYRAREIVKLAQKGFVNNELYISEEMYNQYSLKYGIPKEGDIMVTGVGTLGICYLVKKNDQFYFKDGNIIWLKKSGEINSKFVEYAFKSDYLRKQIDDSVGATVGTFTIIKAKSTLIPITSLPEQQRIVQLLDEAFEKIDTLKANAERNLQNAKELFQSSSQNIFEKRGKDWEEKKLQDVVETSCTLSYGIVQPGNEYADGLPIIRPVDLNSKYIGLSGLKLIDPSLASSYKRTTLRGGELLLCVRGNTGVVSIASQEVNGGNVTRGIVPICFKSKILSQEFGYYEFISAYINKQIKEKTYGAALMQINIGDLRKITILVPPVTEQQTIVEHLDALSARCKGLEINYQKTIAQCDEMKKAVLAKAFNGEL